MAGWKKTRAVWVLFGWVSLSLRHSLSKFVYALLPYWNLNDDQHDCREDKSFKCQECSQSFDTENALNLHVKCASYRGAAKWGILSIYLSIYVSIIIYLCIYLSTYLSISLYLIVYSSQSVCLSVYLLICLSVCFSIFFSISIEAEKRAETKILRHMCVTGTSTAQRKTELDWLANLPRTPWVHLPIFQRKLLAKEGAEVISR